MREVSASDELLTRIGLAVLEVERLRKRKDAARRARNKINCRREVRVLPSGGRIIDKPCWKNFDVTEGWENECNNCRRRYIRQQAFAAESRRLAGARRRVTILARRFRRDF